MEDFPVGDPWTPGNLQRPQISQTQREKVLGLIRSSIDSGARLVTGGGIPDNLPIGYYVSPTLLAEVDPDAQVPHEEIFGPVLTVTAYDTEDDAVSIANNSIYGLSREVSSGDVDRALGWPSACARATSPSTESRTSASPARSAAPSRVASAAPTATRVSVSTWRAERSVCPAERSPAARVREIDASAQGCE